MLYDLFWKCLYTHSLVCKVTSVLVANKVLALCVCAGGVRCGRGRRVAAVGGWGAVLYR